MSELEQPGLLPQPRGGAASQFQTDFIHQLVTHASNLTGPKLMVNLAKSAKGANHAKSVMECAGRAQRRQRFRAREVLLELEVLVGPKAALRFPPHSKMPLVIREVATDLVELLNAGGVTSL